MAILRVMTAYRGRRFTSADLERELRDGCGGPIYLGAPSETAIEGALRELTELGVTRGDRESWWITGDDGGAGGRMQAGSRPTTGAVEVTVPVAMTTAMTAAEEG